MHINIYLKETFGTGDFFWKFLCIVFDNEALGILERILNSQQLEYKVEKTSDSDA